ncbi:MAG: SBP bac 5 protein [Candidatus Magasanikbacteria bacterium]|nr:SBP bac 5 protein [Candidatus Magasanikbacteria bacterium]
MRQATPQKWPAWKQLKYLGNFLDAREKKMMALWTILLTIGLLTLGWRLYSVRRVTVPTVGGEFREAIVGQPILPNPIFSQTNPADADIVKLVYSGLLRLDGEGKLVGDLAESWSVSDDGKTYTFKLRDGIKWHDGEKFSVDDVVFTLETIKDPVAQSPWRFAFQNVNVTKLDDRALAFTLETPFAAFAQALTVGILPEHIWAAVQPTNIRLAQANVKPIGTGPYKFASFTKDSLGAIQSYTLNRSPDFYRPTFIEGVSFKYVTDVSAAEEEFMSKRVDGFTYVTAENRERLTKKDVKSYSVPLPQYTAAFLNGKGNELLKDKNLRRALASAIDRQRLVHEGLQDAAVVLAGPIAPGLAGYSSEIAAPSFDLAAAEKLLADAKWGKISREDFLNLRREELIKQYQAEVTTSTANGADTNNGLNVSIPNGSTTDTIRAAVDEQLKQEIAASQTIFLKKNKTPLTLTITTSNTADNIRVTKMVAEMWEQLGVQTVLRIVEPSRIARDVLRKRDFEVLIYGEALGHEPDLFPFWHSSQIDDPGFNLTGYVNREVDKLLEEARISTSTVARTQKYVDAQKKIVDDLPAIFLVSPQFTYLVRDRVNGVKVQNVAVPAERFQNVEAWYEKTGSKWK